MRCAFLTLAVVVGDCAAFQPIAPLTNAWAGQRTRNTQQRFISLLENTDEAPEDLEAKFEEKLGMLVFSSADPALDIARDLEFYEGEFKTWLVQKADDSNDLEERTALRSLSEMIDDVAAKIEEAMLSSDPMDTMVEEEDDLVLSDPNPGLGDGNVLQNMKNIQTYGIENDEAERALLEKEAQKAVAQKAKARKTYLDLIKAFMAIPEDKLAETVTENYFRCDLEFLEVAKQEVKNAHSPAEGAKIQNIIDAVMLESNNRIATATERLKAVLSAGAPPQMEMEIAKLARSDQIDGDFLLMLQANLEQALAAGPAGAGPAQVMQRLLKKAQDEMDSKKSPEQALMSRLLRTESSEDRMQILTDAFTPKEKLILTSEQDGPEEEPMPEVKPPDFIEIAKTMIRNFGNLGVADQDESLLTRMLMIGAEAEQVSTSIFGESMTPKEQQDRMWADGTMSIWDLETLEQQAEIMGETMPWHGEVDENKMLQKMSQGSGFDEKGVKQIGGG